MRGESFVGDTVRSQPGFVAVAVRRSHSWSRLTCPAHQPEEPGQREKPEQVQPANVTREYFHLLKEEMSLHELRGNLVVGLCRVRDTAEGKVTRNGQAAHCRVP